MGTSMTRPTPPVPSLLSWIDFALVAVISIVSFFVVVAITLACYFAIRALS